jgi:tetratricopeptide (TPR) repeat protein/DNA-binding CsgD family transcriptional regulator
MFKKIFVSFVLLNFSLSFGQNTESKYKKIYHKFLKVQFSNPDLSKRYLDSILVLPNISDSIISKTYNDVGIYHAVTSDYDRSIQYFKKAYNFDNKISKLTKANILCNIGNVQKLQGKNDVALQNYNKAKSLYTLLKDEKNILKVESEIGSVYYNNLNFNKALEVATKLIPRLEAFGDEKLLNIQLLRLANIQFYVGNFKAAIINYTKTLDYFSKDIDNNKQNKFVALMNIGECYSFLKDAKAIDFLNKALIGFQSINDLQNENHCKARLGKYYFNKQEYTIALPYLKEAYEIMIVNFPNNVYATYAYYLQNLIKLNRLEEVKVVLDSNKTLLVDDANLEEKIFMLQSYAVAYNKLKNKHLELETLRALETLYKVREKENTFEELQKKLNLYNIKDQVIKNKNLKLQNKNLKLQNWIILISVFLLIIVVLYFVDKFRKKNKIQKLNFLQLQQEKEIQEKSNELKAIQFQLELEVKQTKERELTALQLKMFQIKDKVIAFLNSNDLKLDSKVKDIIFKEVVGCFENEDYWGEFQLKFTKVHPDFTINIKNKIPKLTKKDIDFLMLVMLNLSNKEIANLINITHESVLTKKYLLRKKMNISNDVEILAFLKNI